MKQKGFTLIELLAVIVILAIIALIATPIVMNVIENTRKGAAERSMENIEHASEVYYYSKKLDNNFEGTIFTCNGESCSNGNETLDISGTVPTEGNITITGDGGITLNSMVINSYVCVKVDNKYSCNKSGKITANSNTGTITITDNKLQSLSNYRIYGNSYQITTTGAQMIDLSGIITDAWNNEWHGITWVTRDQKVYVKGLSNYESLSRTDEVEFDITGLTGTYYISGSDLGQGASVRVMITNSEGKKSYPSEKSFTLDGTEKEVVVYFQVGKADLLIDTILYPMLNEGTTKKSWEPYTGGQPSPSQTYPQEIENVGDKIVIQSDPNYGKYRISIAIGTKNIFNKEEVVEKNGYYFGNDGVLRTADTGYTENYIEVKPSTKYSSTNLGSLIYEDSTSPAEKQKTGVYFYDENKNFLYREVTFWGNNGFKFTTPENCKYIRLHYIASGDNRVDWDTVQILEPESIDIYLDEPLRCVEGVCDYIDFKTKTLVRNVEVVDDTGTKTISDSYKLKAQPEIAKISLPDIPTNGQTTININTNLIPTKLEVEYYN